MYFLWLQIDTDRLCFENSLLDLLQFSAGCTKETISVRLKRGPENTLKKKITSQLAVLFSLTELISGKDLRRFV